MLAPLSSPSSSTPLPQSVAQLHDAPARFGGPLHEDSFNFLEEPPNSDVDERASIDSRDEVAIPSLSRQSSAEVASLSAESPFSSHRDSAATLEEQPAAEDPTDPATGIGPRALDTPTCSDGEGVSECEQHGSEAGAESTAAPAPRRDLGDQLPEDPVAPTASHVPVERPSMSQVSAMANFKSAAAAVGCLQAARQNTVGGAPLASAAVPLSTLSLGAKKSSAVHRPSIAQKIMRLGASGSDSDGSSTGVPGGGDAHPPRMTGDDDSDFD